MPSFPVLAISSVLGILVPMMILFGRFAVKRQRQANLEDLRQTLQNTTGKDASLFPAFEFALQKYDLHPLKKQRSVVWEYLFYCCTASVFMLLSVAGFYLLIGPVGEGDPNSYRFILGGFQQFPWQENANEVTNHEVFSVAVIAFSFLGAYLWSIQYLIRRVAVYDLSPTSFLRVTSQVILGASLATIIRHVAGGVLDESEEWSTSTLLCIAFLVGFFPNAGLDLLMRKLPHLRLKRLDPQAAAAFRTMPVDMVDGVDSQVSFRLAEREIFDVENLATENPILLCAETPYSFMQIVDWIGQAQLALEVGPGRYRELRDLGCRTIPALEAIASGSDMEREALKILASQDQNAPTSLASRIAAMKAHLHVQRLCVICDVLSDAMKAVATSPSPDASDKTGNVWRLA